MELEHASVSMDMKATPSILSADVVESVKLIPIVPSTSPAYETSALILALELAEAMHCVKLQTMYLFAHARLGTQEIHSSHVEKSPERLHRELIHAYHHLAAPILNVVK